MAEPAHMLRVRRMILALLVLVALAAAGGYAWLAHHYRAPGPAQHTVRVQVRAGDTLRQVFSRMQALGALNAPRAVELYLRLTGAQPRMEIGVYDIPARASPADIVQMFEAGRVVLDKLTVVEGATFAQFLAALDADPDVVPSLRGKSDAQIMAALGHPGEQPEGRFFPDTYRFSPGTSDLTILAMAYDQMSAELAKVWHERRAGLPLKNSYQALILASLIEKETGVADERARIAGVFVRRLRDHMLLQTDPSVIYGMGARYDGNIRKSDLTTDTPYNTYTRPGLPPTPIALPGKPAIEAALHPAAGDSLYFVARGDGGHVFASSLAEHNRNVDCYQRKHCR